MPDFQVVPSRTALINVDLQNCFVEWTPNGLDIVEIVNQIAEACRRVGILVVHTSHVLRPDGSNIGVLGEMRPKLRELGILNRGTETAALHAGLVVDPADVLVEKPRFGAFHGTDLDLILNARGIDTVIITGIETNVCCDTTAREANSRDLRVLFVSDATATGGTKDMGPEDLQRTTLATIGSLFGQVLTTEALLQKINAFPAGT